MKKNLLIIILVLITLSLTALLIRPKDTQYQENSNNVGDEAVSSKEFEKNDQDPRESGKASTLDLSNQDLEELPVYVLSRTNLEELDISNNNIKGALPAEIRHLQNLRILDASNNAMTGVPAEVGQLVKLEILDLSNNQLTGLPYELGNLENLKILNLSGNDYAQQDLEIIREGLPGNVEIIL